MYGRTIMIKLFKNDFVNTNSLYFQKQKKTHFKGGPDLFPQGGVGVNQLSIRPCTNQIINFAKNQMALS